MKFEPSCTYVRFDQQSLEEGIVTSWITREIADTCWDSFLRDIPLGQFQQSTIWALAKKMEGWNSLRVVFTLKDAIVGGFQILERSSWWGKIGYVSKGPVILPDRPTLSLYVTEILQKIVRKEKLWALIAQPPDRCTQISSKLAASNFLHNVLIGVIEATWVVDLRDGFAAVEKRMKSVTRRQAKQAVERGITIREGGKDDIGTFFELMLATCRRQGVAPTPADVRFLIRLWDAGQTTGLVRITFAEWEGKPVAGQFEICFGDTVTLWKKGWDSSESKRFPNDILTHQSFKWASLKGYKFYDYVAFEKKMAVTMLRGDKLTEEQKNSRYVFFTRMGGGPRFLPEARIYIPNSFLRFAYRWIFYKKMRIAKENSRLVDQTIGIPRNV